MKQIFEIQIYFPISKSKNGAKIRFSFLFIEEKANERIGKPILTILFFNLTQK